MQLGQAQVVRNNWNDRSLTILNHCFYITTAPHGVTVRGTYTVPANRTAKIILTPQSVRRVTEGTGIIAAYIRYKYTPDGGTLLYFATTTNHDPTIYSLTQNNINSEFIMTSGDNIEWETGDNGTDGLCAYNGGFIVNEYDT